MRYLEIGNEERGVLPGRRLIVRPDYPERFAALAAAAARVDPDLTLIMAPWLWNETELAYPENRDTVRRLLQAARPYHTLWDIHVGGDGLRDADTMERFIPQLRAYVDELDPGNAVRFCILEENGGRHDLQRALGHAHTITTVERLSGAGEPIAIDCPANCLQAWEQNDNAWDQGQLFYTPSQVWGMPPYYAQQMLAGGYQPLCVPATVTGDGRALDVTAARSEDDATVVVKAVNLEAAAVPATLAFAGEARVPGRVRITCLSGALDAANTPDAPRAVAPAEEAREWDGGAFEHVFPGYSFTVMSVWTTMTRR